MTFRITLTNKFKTKHTFIYVHRSFSRATSMLNYHEDNQKQLAVRILPRSINCLKVSHA